MSGEKEIRGWIDELLAEKGCDVLVDVNEIWIFIDPDGREWQLELWFQREAPRKEDSA